MLHALLRLAKLVVGLTVAATTLGLTAIALLPAFDARAMAVTSASMDPSIEVGGLIVVHTVDPDTVQVGDIITFSGYTTDTLTTHRVVARRVVDDRLHFQTKGDANDSADVDLAPAEGVFGRVALDVPYAGRVLAELQRPAAKVALLGIPSLWFFASHLVALRAALRARRALESRPPTVRRSPRLAAFMVLTLAVGLGWSATPTTGATLTDATAINANTFETGTWS